MTKTRKRLFHPLSWAVLRAPLLPVEAFTALTQEPPSTGDASRYLASERDADADEGAQAQLALQVGAGNLARAMDNGGELAKDVAKKQLRYQIRMSTRPTPYGVFAGVALCRVGPSTELAIDERRHLRQARPDMEWLLSFIAALQARDAVFRQLSFSTHPVLYTVSGRVLLEDPCALSEGAAPVSIVASPFVLAALAIAKTGAHHDQLVQGLVVQCGADASRANALVRELSDQGFLLSDLRPPMTGAAPATVLLNRLRSLPQPPAETAMFAAALSALDGWQSMAAGPAARAWPALDALFVALHEGPKTRIQVDLALGLTPASIGQHLADEAADIAELLLRLSPVPHGPPALQNYRAAFVSRYGNERLVPLLELLHPQTGLGLPVGQGGQGVDAQRLAKRQLALQTLAQEALADRRDEVQLDDALLERLALWEPQLQAFPPSMDMCLMVLADSMAAVNAGDYRLLVGPSVGARQAGRYLGRFAGLLGPAAQAALAEAAAAERSHDNSAVWAESVHLPKRLRSANVAIRPFCRDHEIVLGVPPGVPVQRVIALDALSVAVRGQRLRLYWSGREVRVCAGHMLTPFHAPKIIRFLEELGQDGIAQLSGFDWGPAVGALFLPRVVRGRVVLAPAQWRVSRAALSGEDMQTAAGFAKSLFAYRKRWRMPRFVYLVEGDNRLLLDLESAAQAEQIRDEITRHGELGSVVIQEALPGPQHAWLPTRHGHAFMELVVPVVARVAHVPGLAAGNAPTLMPPLSNEPVAATSVLSSLRPPGSDWLFVKLYGPAESEESLVAGAVRRFCHAQVRIGHCANWFFIRYADPDSHLRLRMRGDPNRLLRELMPEICEWGAELMAAGQIAKFSFDTYEREVERYGGPAGMAWAEAFFAADSQAVADMLGRLGSGPSLDSLSLLTVSVDSLLEDLGLDEIERLSWLQQQVATSHAGGTEYRQRKAALRAWYATAAERSAAWPEWLPALIEQRSQQIRPLGLRWSALQRDQKIGASRDFLLSSIVHLHCNRLAGIDRRLETQVMGVLLRLRQGLSKAPVLGRERGDTKCGFERI